MSVSKNAKSCETIQNFINDKEINELFYSQ